MTQRSMFVGKHQTIIIKVGDSVTIKGQEGERLIAETSDTADLTIERRSESEIGRARAAVGEHVLFDIRLKMPHFKGREGGDEVIEVQIGSSGEVLVPFESNLKVYAGKDIDVQGIQGHVDAFSGSNLNMQHVYQLGNASAGGTMQIDCQTMSGKDASFSAGNDLRFYVAELTNARLRVKDIGGYWEAHIGKAERSVHLKSGGDVTFVTDQQVDPLPPNYVLGKIEKPAKA